MEFFAQFEVSKKLKPSQGQAKPTRALQSTELRLSTESENEKKENKNANSSQQFWKTESE